MVNVYLVDYLCNALCIVVASALVQEIKAAQCKRERERERGHAARTSPGKYLSKVLFPSQTLLPQPYRCGKKRNNLQRQQHPRQLRFLALLRITCQWPHWNVFTKTASELAIETVLEIRESVPGRPEGPLPSQRAPARWSEESITRDQTRRTVEGLLWRKESSLLSLLGVVQVLVDAHLHFLSHVCTPASQSVSQAF